jgi:DeoR family galactitol utilization operon repressor
LTIGLSQRERELLDLLAEDANRTVAVLSKALGVSAVTVRSDLASLADKGLIVRTHGGAFPAFRPNILERQRHMVEAKTRIVKAAAAMVANGDTIMMCAGTTTSLMARYLLGKSDVKVVTNSTLILPYARINPALHVTLAGGEFRPADEAMVGPNTLGVLEQFHVRIAFLGTDGFSLESGITANSVETATAARKMAQQAQQTIVLADSSKYGRAGFAHIMGMNQVSLVITDDQIADEHRKVLEENQIQIKVV